MVCPSGDQEGITANPSSDVRHRICPIGIDSTHSAILTLRSGSGRRLAQKAISLPSGDQHDWMMSTGSEVRRVDVPSNAINQSCWCLPCLYPKPSDCSSSRVYSTEIVLVSGWLSSSIGFQALCARKAFPSGRQLYSVISWLRLLTCWASPPASGSICICAEPFRSLRNARDWPSGDQRGAKSRCLLLPVPVNCLGVCALLSLLWISQMALLVVLVSSSHWRTVYAISEPSGEICGSLTTFNANKSSTPIKGFVVGIVASCVAGTWIVVDEAIIVSWAMGRGVVAISSFSIIYDSIR